MYSTKIYSFTDSRNPILGSKIFAIPKSPSFKRLDCMKNMLSALISLKSYEINKLVKLFKVQPNIYVMI